MSKNAQIKYQTNVNNFAKNFEAGNTTVVA